MMTSVSYTHLIIPGAATSAALIYVGVLMLQGLKNVNFDDICLLYTSRCV